LKTDLFQRLIYCNQTTAHGFSLPPRNTWAEDRIDSSKSNELRWDAVVTTVQKMYTILRDFFWLCFDNLFSFVPLALAPIPYILLAGDQDSSLVDGIGWKSFAGFSGGVSFAVQLPSLESHFVMER
jgi:hypothetical protein